MDASPRSFAFPLADQGPQIGAFFVGQAVVIITGSERSQMTRGRTARSATSRQPVGIGPVNGSRSSGSRHALDPQMPSDCGGRTTATLRPKPLVVSRSTEQSLARTATD